MTETPKEVAMEYMHKAEWSYSLAQMKDFEFSIDIALQKQAKQHRKDILKLIKYHVSTDITSTNLFTKIRFLYCRY